MGEMQGRRLILSFLFVCSSGVMGMWSPDLVFSKKETKGVGF
jgi:hypothetical protein